MCIDALHDMLGVPTIRQVPVRRVAIGRNVRTGDGIGDRERVQRFSGKVSDDLQADTPGQATVVPDFDRSNQSQFADRAATSDGDANVLVPGVVRHRGFVDLNQPVERRPLRIDHRLAQLVQQEPRRLVGADAELGLQLQRRDAVGMGRDQMRGQEPRPQRELGAVHDGAGGDGGLSAAVSTFPGPSFAIEPPRLGATAGRAMEAIRPAALGKVGRAGIIVMELLHERLQRGWTVVLPSACHAALLADASLGNQRNY